MIKFIVTVKSDFRNAFIQEFHREQILGACRMEDNQKTTERKKNEMLLCLEYYFKNIPFINNGHIGTRSDAQYSAFAIVTASRLVREWVETNQSFGITLQLDLDTHTYNLLCSSIEEWYIMNQLFEVPYGLLQQNKD